MEPIAWPYAIYALTAIVLTVGLANMLHRNGKVFLAELFPGEPNVARAVNSLLLTGFFMLNLGYGFLISKVEPATTAFAAMESLIQRLGVLLVSLGVIHFVNMFVLWKIRRSMTETTGVPVAANVMVPPPPAGNFEFAAPAPN